MGLALGINQARVGHFFSRRALGSLFDKSADADPCQRRGFVNGRPVRPILGVCRLDARVAKRNPAHRGPARLAASVKVVQGTPGHARGAIGRLWQQIYRKSMDETMSLRLRFCFTLAGAHVSRAFQTDCKAGGFIGRREPD